MPHKLLNRLSSKCGLPDPPQGSWRDDAATGSFLDEFAQCTDNAADMAAVYDVHSVPSVYAQPIIFAEAFLEKTHPSHGSVVDQWRGLLAIFALKPWFGFNITFGSYPIGPPPPGAASSVGNAPGGPLHLNTMLDVMLPEPRTLWNPLRLFNATVRWWGVFRLGRWVLVPRLHCPRIRLWVCLGWPMDCYMIQSIFLESKAAVWS